MFPRGRNENRDIQVNGIAEAVVKGQKGREMYQQVKVKDFWQAYQMVEETRTASANSSLVPSYLKIYI